MVGAVLAGGPSRRMGTDKALVRTDGVAMAVRVADAMAGAGATAIVLVGADARAASALGLETIDDDAPGTGPLGGLVTILTTVASAGDRPSPGPVDASTIVVVAACDQPSLTGSTLSCLVDALAVAPAHVGAARLQTPDGRLHPLPSAWRAQVAAGPVVELFRSGERRIGAAFDAVAVLDVAGDPHDIVDLDTPGDLDRWHQARRDQSPGTAKATRRLA